MKEQIFWKLLKYMIIFLLLQILLIFIHSYKLSLPSFKDEPDHYYYKDHKVFPNINRKYQNFFQDNFFLSDTTIVTQMSIERLSRLNYLRKKWKYRISVVLYVLVYSNNYDDFSVNKYLNQEKIDLSKYTNVQFHIVLGRDSSIFYPLNLLRNIAWKHVTTPLVFSLDIDFLPSDNLVRVMKRLNPNFVKKIYKKNLLIVPAFDNSCKFESHTEIECKRIKPLYSQGQNATRFDKWRIATEPYKIKYEIFYEPYFIGPTNMVKYDESFTIGHDKTTHMYELMADRYELYVVNYAYIGHIPHSSGIKHSLKQKFYHFHDAWKRWNIFVRRILNEYGYKFYCNKDIKIKGYMNSVIRRDRKKFCGKYE